MLINENLLRNIIKHALTQKLLRETTEDITFSDEEVSEYDANQQLKQAQEGVEKLKNFLKAFENMNINNNSQILEKVLCKIIYEVIVISCLFKKNKVILGENVVERGDSKLIEIINNFINRKGREIDWDSNKISDKDKSKYASTTKEMKTFFLALGLQYHTFFIESKKTDDNRTGGQIARLYKKQAVKKVLEILQSQKILSSYIDELTKKSEDDLNFSEDPKKLEGNQQQTTSASKNSVNDDDNDLKDYNDIGMDSKLPSSTDFKNSQKTQWPKTFLTQRTKRTPVETIIRNQEGDQYSTPIEEIFKNVLERNMSWKTEQNDLINHLSGYVKFLTNDNNWEKYGKYTEEIKNKLIELVDKLSNDKAYKEKKQKDFIVNETKKLINTLFKGAEAFYQEKLQKRQQQQNDKKFMNDFLNKQGKYQNQKRNQFTSNQKNNSLF